MKCVSVCFQFLPVGVPHPGAAGPVPAGRGAGGGRAGPALLAPPPPRGAPTLVNLHAAQIQIKVA